jgi:hypothetical protein
VKYKPSASEMSVSGYAEIDSCWWNVIVGWYDDEKPAWMFRDWEWLDNQNSS